MKPFNILPVRCNEGNNNDNRLPVQNHSFVLLTFIPNPRILYYANCKAPTKFFKILE